MVDVPRDRFEELVGDALDAIPEGLGRLMDNVGFDVPNLKAYLDRISANGVTLDVPYGRDAELGLMSATLTDPWGVTIRLTEGLSAIAGLTPYTYVDGYVVAKPIE